AVAPDQLDRRARAVGDGHAPGTRARGQGEALREPAELGVVVAEQPAGVDLTLGILPTARPSGPGRAAVAPELDLEALEQEPADPLQDDALEGHGPLPGLLE